MDMDPMTVPGATALLRALGWTLHAPGEPCPPVTAPHAYTGTQDTSRLAALQAAPRSGTQRHAVLRVIADRPRTDVEVQRHLGMAANTERPRRVELVDGGWVEDSGERRRHDGREHIVWRWTGKRAT